MLCPANCSTQHRGTYNENIVIDKRIRLVGIPEELGAGSDTGKPIIKPSNALNISWNSALFTISASNCTVTGFKLTDNWFGHGLLLDNVSLCTVWNLDISNNSIGILLNKSITSLWETTSQVIW